MSPRIKQRKAQERLETLVDEYKFLLERIDGGQYNHGTEARSTHPADGNAELLMMAVPTRRCIEEELRQARHAQARGEVGLYGICEVCGCEIPPARLDVLPSATACVQCAGKVR